MPPRMRSSRTVADIGEFGFLSRMLPRLATDSHTIVGPGQDCAVVSSGRRTLLTVDALVEGVHFEPAWLSPRQLGRKSFLVNASDIAAMGGRPRFCVVSVGIRPSYLTRDLSALQAGIVAAAAECGASVVGGNLTRADKLFVSITLLGDAPARLVTRQGAHPGDHIYVTGWLGDAALAVRLLRAGEVTGSGRFHPIRRFREPSARLHAGQSLVDAGIVSAMIDVSDGLIQDLGHICTESGVAATIDPQAIPVSSDYRAMQGPDRSLALTGGEDYELLCTVPERNVKRLRRLQSHLGCPITCVGRIEKGRGVRLAGDPSRVAKAAGFDHFLQR
jgi:thiamine-monophosphate kinase